eukprot:5058770-Amphidinium_carterae.1
MSSWQVPADGQDRDGFFVGNEMRDASRRGKHVFIQSGLAYGITMYERSDAHGSALEQHMWR